MRPAIVPFLILAAAAVAARGGPPPASAPVASRERLDGVVLVRFAGAYAGMAAAEAAAGPALAAEGMRLEASAAGLPWARVRLAEGQPVEAALQALARDARYAVVQPVYVYRALAVPDDPDFGDQWHLRNTGQSGGTPGVEIRATEAWDLFRGDTNVEIAVLDSGADTDHPDLGGRLRLVAGNDLVDGDDDPDDDSTTFGGGHGTAVAGVVGAVTNNATQVAGVTWFGRVVPFRVLDSSGAGTSDRVATAIDRARVAGVRVINLSLGGPGGPGLDPILDAAIANAAAAGIVIVAAAGNTGGEVLYPANHPSVLAAGSHGRTGAVSSFSNRGLALDLVAPGESIRTLRNQGGVQTTQGTSLSTPMISGAAMLAWGARPGADTRSIGRWIRATATNAKTSAWTESAGAGRLDARRLLEIALSNPAYGVETGVVLFDSYTNQTLAETTAGTVFSAAGRNGGPALALGTPARAGYAAASVPETGTVELYWKPAPLPAGAETRALIASETAVLAVDAAGALRLAFRGVGNLTSTTRVHAGQWYHIAVTFTETHAALWVNGVAEETAAGAARLGGETLYVGGRPGETTAAGLYDQLRFSNVARSIFPSALDAAVPPGPWATSVVGTLTAPWWSLSSETRPVTVTIGADTDTGGLDGTVLGSGLVDDMRENLSIEALAIGTPYFLYVIADDGIDTAWAYSTVTFTPALSVTAQAVAPGGGGGGCLLERLGAPGLARLRAIRDRLLAWPIGRLVAMIYYS